MRKKIDMVLPLMIACVLALAPYAFAQEPQSVKRLQLMKELDNIYNNDLMPMGKGAEKFDLIKTRKALNRIEIISEQMTSLFEKPPQAGEASNALPEIWKRKTDFNRRWQTLGEAALTLEDTVTNTNSLMTTITELGDICTSCHERYKAP